MGGFRFKNFNKYLAEKAQEREALPEDSPDFQDFIHGVREQFEAHGMYGTHDDEGMPDKVELLIFNEASERYAAMLAYYGASTRRPFITRAAMVATGHWVPKVEHVKRATTAEVDRIIQTLYWKMDQSDFAKLSDQQIADLVPKYTKGKTTTRQTVSKCETRRKLKQMISSEKESKARKFRQS